MSEIVVANGSIKLICEICGKEHKVTGDKLEFELNSSIDRKTLLENVFFAQYKFPCDCKRSISVQLFVNEYPEKTLNGTPQYIVNSAEKQGEFEINFY
jgi:hypothetical protein